MMSSRHFELSRRAITSPNGSVPTGSSGTLALRFIVRSCLTGLALGLHMFASIGGRMHALLMK